MSLKRTLEPEVMDSDHDATVYDSMDHSAVNQCFVADLLAFYHPTGEVLDLGTGTARIPIELCRQNAEARVVAIDFSTSMLDIARINLEIAGLMDRIMLDHVDAKSIDYPDGRFEMVMSNSLIHHLPEPSGAIDEAVRLVAANGHLFFRDLMRPETPGVVDELVEKYAGDEDDDARQLFCDSLHAALNLEEIRQLVSEIGFAAETVQATSDRHWTWAARRDDLRTNPSCA